MKSPVELRMDWGHFETLGIVLVSVVLAGLGLLAVGLTRGNYAAHIVLGALLLLIAEILTGSMFMLVMKFAYHLERGRAEQERARMEEVRQEQAQHNQEAISSLTGIQRVQNQQNQMLLRQAREARLLPAPGDTVDGDYIAFNESLLAGIDEELED